MADDLAHRSIRVNAVAPGPIATEGLNGLSGRAEEASQQVPLKRIGSAAEIAELIYWLVDGEGAKFITGETLVSSGGLFMR
jgi:3-oxoacyl-[acyl-carrier protein] reductase